MKVNYYNQEIHKGNFPIRVLAANIEYSFLNLAPNFKKEFETLLTQNNIENKILIEINLEPIVNKYNIQPAFIKASDKIIRINEIFLAFLWILCYSFLVIYDEVVSKFALNLHRGKNLMIDNNKKDEAFVLFNYGLSLINKYSQWDKKLPNPEEYDNSNESIEQANALFEYAVAFILAHEFAHIKHGHLDMLSLRTKPPKYIEYEADEEASDLLINTISCEKDKAKMGFGLIVATTSSLFINNMLMSSSHPAPDERLKIIMEKLDLPEIDHLWGLSWLVFEIWKKCYHIELKSPEVISNYKDLFYQYLEQCEILKNEEIN